MKYFKECKNLDEAKNLYRKLSKELHPDKGGTHEGFIKMHDEFDNVCKVLKFKSGKEEDKNFDADKFYNDVRQFEGLEDIKISFVGTFIWLEDITTGAMWSQKEIIKGIKIDGKNPPRWNKKRKSWFYSPLNYKQRAKCTKTLEELKNKWGNTSYNTKGTQKLTA